MAIPMALSMRMAPCGALSVSAAEAAYTKKISDQLYLPGCGRMDMGLRLAGLSAGRGLPGLCERQCKQLQTSCSIVNLSEDVSAANPNPKPKA